jgi:translation initiation factor IF-2
MFEGSRSVGRVRAIFNEYGKRLDVALPGTPAEVLGFSFLPPVGEIVRNESVMSEAEAVTAQVPKDLDQFMADMDEAAKKKLKILLKADTTGSLEAIIGSLPKEVTIVRKDLGDITEADILDAKSSKALVVGFNVKIGPNIETLARTEKVIYRTYTIIYELLKEIADVVEGLEVVLAPERELGRGQIIAEFPYEGQRIAGTKVVSGRLARGDTVKIVRDEAEIARVKIKSMRRAKEEVNKVEEGVDCGILLDKKLDFALGDAIIAVTTG